MIPVAVRRSILADFVSMQTPPAPPDPAIALVTKGTAPRRDFLGERDVQARLAGRNYVAVLPGNGCLENLGVEAAPGLDALQDQGVGQPRGAEVGCFDNSGHEPVHSGATACSRDLIS